MKPQPRIYSSILLDHMKENRQMAFVTGPRQVGKTTTCSLLGDVYLDWDNQDHREIILAGPGAVSEHAGLHDISNRPKVIVLDELHKYSKWKNFLKGFFDREQDRVRILVTGSSRLDVYRRGSDSLMGRYFSYRMHPFSVGELVRSDTPDSPVSAPKAVEDEDWISLLIYGGYPEPFTKKNNRFSRRWIRSRLNQLVREDVRDMSRIQEIDQLATLARLLSERSGGQIVYSTLAGLVRMSENTVRSWIGTLSSLHFGFLVRPWYRNVTKALRKEPKWFLRDWSAIEDKGQRSETLIACHLLKAVEGWTDLGFGEFELRYVRDKQKREVDFLVIRDNEPWFLVEVKASSKKLSPSLSYFQKQLGCPHAFQVVTDLEYVDANCFSYNEPVRAPARTFLSQLL